MNRFVLLGTFLRNCAGSINTYYVPVFFLKNYPTYKTAFATLNAIDLSVLGLLSGIIAGVISDRYETKNKNYMTKAFIIALGCFIATPMMALCTLQTSNFWLSIGSHMILTFMIANFSGQAITMM